MMYLQSYKKGGAMTPEVALCVFRGILIVLDIALIIMMIFYK